MSDTYLVLSNPPHGDVDDQRVAQAFGFTAIDARMRMHFPAPEIWFADEDLASLKRVATALQSAGTNVRIIKGSLLSLVPAPDDLRSFSLDGDQFVGDLEGGGSCTVPYSGHMAMVSCRPQTDAAPGTEPRARRASGEIRDNLSARSGFGPSPHEDSIGEAATDEAFLDMYFVSQSRVQRATVRPAKVDFSGLGGQLKPDPADNQVELLNRLRDRFRRTDLDERLMDVPIPKPSLVSGKALQAILESIDPALKSLPTIDLQSRLAFLSRL